MMLRGALVLSIVGLLACACSSSDSSGGSHPPASCTTDPSTCAAGTVCWPNNANGDYACLPAAAGQGQGSTCSNVIGQPQCDVGLACFPSANGSPTGMCEPFCGTTAPDNTKCTPPGSSGQCYQLKLQAPHQYPIYVCQPAAPTNDGGAGASGSGGSAGASGSAGTGGAGGSDAGADATTD